MAKIVKALEIAGRLTTRELAAAVGASRDAVYQRCKRLERDGRLVSERVGDGEKKIFFSPMTMEIVTRDNYEQIDLVVNSIAETIRAYSIPQDNQRLVSALEVQFERVAERFRGPAMSAIEEFAEEIIDAAARAEKRGDVMNLLGIRPMRPTVRVWELGRQLSLT